MQPAKHLQVRRLGRGDEAILHRLALEDAEFDVADRGEARSPLDAAAAGRYLENPAVLHWIALDGDIVVGSLYCLAVPLESDDGVELLLYSIGVRREWRRRGVGRVLAAEMERWMREHGVVEVWVLADNAEAVAFYRACGFEPEQPQPVYLTRRLAP